MLHCNQGRLFVARSMSECSYFDASHHAVDQTRNRNLERHARVLSGSAVQGLENATKEVQGTAKC